MQDAGGICGIRPQILRLERLVGKQQCGSFGSGHPGHVRSLSSTTGNAVTQTFKFPGTDGGWRPKLGDTAVPSDCYREKQNWRGGRHDQSRLKTMPTDGTSVREASATTTTGQAVAEPELRRALVAVPPSSRKPAGGHGAISRSPLRSFFGGQGRKPANVGVHTKTRTMEISQFCAPLREKRTCQPKLIRAHPLVQTHCEHCNNFLSSVLLHGHASPTPPRLLRLL